MLILAEALDEPEAVATALGALGTGYHNLGAYHGGAILLESAAGIAREHHLPFPLARALNNLAAFQNGRDLAAALRHAQECAEVARRAGLEGSVENAMVNYAIGLWCAGRLVELAEIIPNGLEAAQPGMAFTWWTLDVWLADAVGTTPPPPLDEPDTDAQSDLAWRRCGDLSRALTAGDPAEVARMAPVVLGHAMAAAGIDDDFFVLWPPLVLGALTIGDLDLAERLIAPVATSMPGRRPPAVAAQWHRLRGLLAAARGDDPQTVEATMRGRGRRPRRLRRRGIPRPGPGGARSLARHPGPRRRGPVSARDRPCDVRRHRGRRLARRARRVPGRPRAVAHVLLDAPSGDGTLIVGTGYPPLCASGERKK